MNRLLVMFFFVFATIQATVHATSQYSVRDLEQLKSTKSCIKCDLGYLTIKEWSNHSGSVLTQSNLNDSYIELSNFSQSDFSGANLNRVKATKTNFIQSNFTNALMSYIKFDMVELSGAVLINANLRSANLSHSNLSRADFTGANTQGVNFDHALLIGSNITAEQLNKAKSMWCALMPDGSVYPANKNERCRN